MSTSRSNFLGVPSWLIILGVMSGIGPITIDLYLPSFPMIESEFGEPGAARTMASYLVGLALGQLLYGPVSDRFGRKAPLYVGFVIYTIGSLGCAAANSMTMLMLLRIVQAVGACSGITISRAIVRDRCAPEEAARAYSTLMMISSAAPILAPIAGGFIVAGLGWRATFLIQSGLGLGILIAMHFLLTESLPPARRTSLRIGHVLNTYGQLFRDRAFLGYALIGGFGMAALFSYVSGAPTILPRMYGVPPETFGWLIGINGVAFMLASRLNIRALRKHSSAYLLSRYVWIPPVVGLALLAAGAYSNWVVAVPLVVTLALQFAFFITTARMLPHTTALALAARAQDAGTASALLGGLQAIASMIAGACIALVDDGTLVPLGAVMTLSVSICSFCFVWIQRGR